MSGPDMEMASGIAAFEAKEFARAMQLLQPLAERGVPEAQYRVAIMAQVGLGMVKNCAIAVKWMRAAAEQGYALAEHGLGFMYFQGECTKADARRSGALVPQGRRAGTRRLAVDARHDVREGPRGRRRCRRGREVARARRARYFLIQASKPPGFFSRPAA